MANRQIRRRGGSAVSGHRRQPFVSPYRPVSVCGQDGQIVFKETYILNIDSSSEITLQTLRNIAAPSWCPLTRPRFCQSMDDGAALRLYRGPLNFVFRTQLLTVCEIRH